jgi:hypothetical protein
MRDIDALLRDAVTAGAAAGAVAAARVAGAIFTQMLPFADPRVLARYAELERAVYPRAR